MKISLRAVADAAAERYDANHEEIEQCKHFVHENRQGRLRLTDIPQDEERMKGRIEREGPLPENVAIERINGSANFQDIVTARKILGCADAVCRITIPSASGGNGYGTGFLIAPGILITNNHVLPDTATAAGAQAQFRYELGDDKLPLPQITFKLRPDIFFLTSALKKTPGDATSGLDFTVVAIDEKAADGMSITDLPHIGLDPEKGKILQGENCIVIQHPGADYKKIVVKDTRLLNLYDDFLVYESDTLPGSSGSIVVGLGTGEVVALHHSGVPRKDAQGRWLRKDGTPVRGGDSDEAIDWLGNEGIRVSSIYRCIEAMPVKAEMKRYKESVLNAGTRAASKAVDPAKKSSAKSKNKSTTTSTAGRSVWMEDDAPDVPATTGAEQELHFELQISDRPGMLDDWAERATDLYAGLQSSDPLFPFSTGASYRRMHYATVVSAKDAWQVAAELEALPHIDAATPDLPVRTDVDTPGTTGEAATEATIPDWIYADGRADENDELFDDKWGKSQWYKTATAAGAKDYRHWNRYAVNFPLKAIGTALSAPEKGTLKGLKLFQLDTGYSKHSKLKGGYDLSQDRDFIGEDDDAGDSESGILLKHPGHGTRTASLVVGGICGYASDGNAGLLFDGTQPLAQVIPYRIARSVVLLGRAAELVDAVQAAVSQKADVMFMCMGTLPRPMIEKAARLAYEAGVIWVCAAGNEVEVVIAPALYPGTIAVAAINPDDKPWVGSSYGPEVDVAAPGEDVYVPCIGKKNNAEIMAFGSGTSYATPHVASAAMIWKAKWAAQLTPKNGYNEPWQVVEAFRHCLKESARKPSGWKEKLYGTGVLDVSALLAKPLPKASDLKHAYAGIRDRSPWDLGVREAVSFFWNLGKRKLTPGAAESAMDGTLSTRAIAALSVFSLPSNNGAVESTGADATGAESLLQAYFRNA